MAINRINVTQLAEELGFSRTYVSAILGGIVIAPAVMAKIDNLLDRCPYQIQVMTQDDLDYEVVLGLVGVVP